MKNYLRNGVCLFVFGTAPVLAIADLSDETYQAAKKAYASNDCNRAAVLFRQYRQNDSEFLAIHPDKLDRIRKAEAYCEKLSTESIDHINAKADSAEPLRAKQNMLLKKPLIPQK
uniref:Uncharacterized protein n=1 Tax=Ralstonia solanacearum TaxID=305 RepID=A0A0S4VCN7_RALSL|nr:exported protein of unknown function [Ralstonia solanacearum]